MGRFAPAAICAATRPKASGLRRERGDAPGFRYRYNRRVTKFAVCFLLVFGELAYGGLFALAIPPFFKIERGFYKSTATVYVLSGLASAIGLGALAWSAGASSVPRAGALWIASAIWLVFCLIFALYVVTLWTDNGRLRARAFSLSMLTGLVAVVANVMLLKPASFGAVAGVAYAATAVTSSVLLGLTSGAMMFGHWYLIDLSMPVDYLRNFVRMLFGSIVAQLVTIGLAIALVGTVAGGAGRSAVATLFDSHLALFAIRVLIGPIATGVLAWMVWQTLKIPQTMAATGLLYIAVMSALVGEMLGRFILFRTSIPL